MNIYDFDNTIFKGDSSCKFIKYSITHHPLLVLKSLIASIPLGVKYLFKKEEFGVFKAKIFSFVKDIDNLEDYMERFTLKNIKNIKNFYLENRLDNDTIISASFEFIIRPFCEKIGIKNIIGTKYNVKTGKIIGKNCKGKEKIKRFRELYKEEDVINAYSDSLSDIPMFEISKNAYIVEGEELIKYHKN